MPRDRLERGGLAGDLLLLEDPSQLRDDPLVRNAPEIEALGPRDDRRGDLARLGGREDEDGVRRRLLERLQKGVERLGRQLVGFIDDIDLVLPHRGSEAHLVPKVPHLVDAAVGRGVDLDEVEKTALPDRDAALAPVAGLAILGVRAVHRLRDEAGDRGLPGPANARQEVGMGDLSVRDRVPERPGDVLLTDDRGEGLGTVAAVDGRALGHLWMVLGDGRAPSVDDECLGHARAHWLGSGLPAARSDYRLPLLPSGPDGVRWPFLHRTRSSTPQRACRIRDTGPREGIQPR